MTCSIFAGRSHYPCCTFTTTFPRLPPAPCGSFCGFPSPTHTTAGRALSNSSLAAEEGRASFPHKGPAGLTEATAAFATDIHSRSVVATNATRTRLLYIVEPDLQGLSSSPACWLVLQTQKCAPGVPHSLMPCSWQILPKALTRQGACAVADLWAGSPTLLFCMKLCGRVTPGIKNSMH